MELAQRSIARVLHHQEREPILYGEIKDAYNVWMFQRCQGLRFLHKLRSIPVCELSMQDFKRCWRFEIDMLPKVDLGKSAMSKQANYLVVTKLLTYQVGHSQASNLSIVLMLIFERE
jgi:hypothetical protein